MHVSLLCRYKELAEIASAQAQMTGQVKARRDEEMKVLSDHCAALESRSDDDILIGRLQRQLISVKSSYKAFTRKYQTLRVNMRQRELAQRVLETQLSEKEDALQTQQESSRLEIGALKRAIRILTNAHDDERIVSEDLFEKVTMKGLTRDQEVSMRLRMRQTLSFIAGTCIHFTHHCISPSFRPPTNQPTNQSMS